MASAAFSVVNAVLYSVVVYGNYDNRHDYLNLTRTHMTLITPASYSFAVYRVIYVLVGILLLTDIVAPSYSIFESNDARMFAWLCIQCMMWYGDASSTIMHLALLPSSTLWALLFHMYLNIQSKRADDFNYVRYLCSELAVSVFFAWTSFAVLVLAAVSLQLKLGKFLPLAAYVGLLTVLSVATVSVIVLNSDWAFGVVVVWALVAVARNTGDHEKKREVELTHSRVRTCATLYAAIVTATMAVRLTIKHL